jgi:hypothetical protein
MQLIKRFLIVVVLLVFSGTAKVLLRTNPEIAIPIMLGSALILWVLLR